MLWGRGKLSYNKGMRRPHFQKFLNQKGQTAVEYLLMTAVAITIGVAFKKKMEDFVLNNPNSVMAKRLNLLNSQFDSSNRYMRFPLRKF